MQYFIKQDSGAAALFTVYSGLGELLYLVAGENTPLLGRFSVRDPAGRECARVSRMGTPSIAQHTIFVGGVERVRVICNYAARKNPFSIKGAPWHFRGDMLRRSFDVLDSCGCLVMTHGCCWNFNADGYGVEVAPGRDALLCLCVALAVDSTAAGGASSAVLAGN